MGNMLTSTGVLKTVEGRNDGEVGAAQDLPDTFCEKEKETEHKERTSRAS